MTGKRLKPGKAFSAVVAVALLFAAVPDRASAERPRIGLALSGGGARGAAHVGVLKVLEELRVPVDCIAGTSMGSVIGGTYAAGMSAGEMERIVIQTDWKKVFDDRPPRSELSVRRKAEDYRGFADPEIGVGPDGLRLPKGVIAGVAIESYLRYLTQPVADVYDFSLLPIPFRAVATDIVSGEAVVLERGSLSRAMRASMAIPGAVAPVEIDGRLLVDGGVANNLPIDVARETCDAQVIIAVNIQTPLLKRDDITSALGVVGQLFNLLGKGTVDAQIATLSLSDVLISPDLGDISAGSFERTPEAVRIGETAARALAGRLRALSVSDEAYESLRASRRLSSRGLGVVDAVRFEGLERTNEQVLRSLVQTAPGETLSEERIGADLRRVFGRGDFESVDYRIVGSDGARTLMIGVREKDTGPATVRAGIGLSTDFSAESQFGLRLSYRRAWLNRFGAEWLVDAQVGRRNALLTELYQPLRADGALFVAPYLSFAQTRGSLYRGNDRVADLLGTDFRAGVDIGTVIGTLAELRFGALARRVSTTVVTGNPQIPDERDRGVGLRATLFVDELDRPYFARSGYGLSAEAYTWQRPGGSEEGAYKRFEGRFEAAKSFGADTLNLTILGGTRLGTRLPAFDAFSLGGPFRLSGHPPGQFLGEGFGFARLSYYRRAYALPNPLGTGVYVGGSLEVGRMNRLLQDGSSTGTLGSASVFIGADTFIGPVFLVGGMGSGGNRAVYLFIGIP